MRKLDAEERRRIRRHGPSKRGPKAGEERLDAPARVQFPHDAADADVALGGLQAALDGVDGEDGDPHGDAGGAAGARDGREGQVALRLAGDGVPRRQPALDVLVGGEVGGAAGAVARERGGGAAEHGPQAALGVQLAHDVGTALVLGLLAGLQALALHLQDHLDALEGGRDGGHGDGAEEAGGGDLRDREALAGGWGGDGGHELLAEVVAPEGDGDCMVGPRLVEERSFSLTTRWLNR